MGGREKTQFIIIQSSLIDGLGCTSGNIRVEPQSSNDPLFGN